MLFFFSLSHLIEFAIVAGIHLVGPGMRQRTHPGSFGIFDIQVERRISFAFGVGLQPYFVFVWQINSARIIITTYTLKRTVSMVERAVFLHQDNDVFGIQVGAAFGALMAIAFCIEAGMKLAKPVAPANRAAFFRKSRLESFIV